MAFSNFYDFKSSGFKEVTEIRRFVSLCIYAFPNIGDLDKLRKKVKDQVEQASHIWCNECKWCRNCNIEILAIDVKQLSEQNPGDLDFNAEHYDSIESVPSLIDMLFDPFYRPECRDIDIAVYYVKGEKFTSGVEGVARYRESLSRTMHFIIMTEGANGEVLAHEIGHHLFIRPDPNNPGHFFDDNPEFGSIDPSVRSHDTRSDALMNVPIYPGETKITELQCITAGSSMLVQKEEVLAGYDPPAGTPAGALRKCTVSFLEMYVFHVSDEIGGPHLETKWKFHVDVVDPAGQTIGIGKVGSWDESDFFGPKRYYLHLGDMEVFIMGVSDRLRIHVTGEDTDTNSNDVLPTIDAIHGSATNWGGDDFYTIRGRNDETMFDLKFTIITTDVTPIRYVRSCSAIVEH